MFFAKHVNLIFFQKMIFKVQKRTGEIVDFDSQKIQKAIFTAAKEVGGHDEKISKDLTKKVVKFLDKQFKDKIPSVEEVQDTVEKILIEEGHAQTAKSYILYREKDLNHDMIEM